MTQGALKNLRFVTPGIIILVYLALLGSITGLWPSAVPDNPKEWISSLSVLILGGLYYILPLRDDTNRKFFDQVSRNIRDRMVAISGLPDQPDAYTWKALRGLFYHFVDSDKSLTAKASLAYFNGLIWTTLADVRALSFPFMLVSIVLWFFGVDRAAAAFALFVVIAGISYYGSIRVTRRHKEIGNEQLEIIELKYRDELRRMMGEIRDRAGAGSNTPNPGGA